MCVHGELSKYLHRNTRGYIRLKPGERWREKEERESAKREEREKDTEGQNEEKEKEDEERGDGERGRGCNKTR